MVNKYYDADCNFSMLDGKTIAILGFGSQGHAHAMNLKESGANVVVGLRPGSAHTAKAEAAGIKVMGIEEAAEAGDIVMILTPDELQAQLYKEQIEKHMKPGNVLAFAHGFNIHFNQIQPSKDLDVIMIAPKGPGHTVRSQYVEAKAFLALSPYIRMLPEKPRTTPSLMPAESAQAEPESWKLHSRKRPRQTSSANRQFSAAVFAS